MNNKKFSYERFIINGTIIESIDISPDNLKTEIPVLVAPGFAATIESFEPLIKLLIESGYRVLSLNHPRRGGIIPALKNKTVKKYPKEELRKAQTILGLLEQKNIKKINVIGHSEASINVSIAAILRPEIFNNFIFFAPAGLIGRDTLLRLVRGVMKHQSHPDSLKNIPITTAETKYLEATAYIGPKYWRDNWLRAFKEVLAISHARIENLLKYLHSKEIKIFVIAAVDDTFFPLTKMEKNIKANSVDLIDNFLVVPGGHAQIQIHPELYLSAIENRLRA